MNDNIKVCDIATIESVANLLRACPVYDANELYLYLSKYFGQMKPACT